MKPVIIGNVAVNRDAVTFIECDAGSCTVHLSCGNTLEIGGSVDDVLAKLYPPLPIGLMRGRPVYSMADLPLPEDTP